MVGGTLRELRERIAALHDGDGRYYVSCARTGERPVPVDGRWFPDRETAVEAAETATSYRAELRCYDPQVPCYDLIASEEAGTVLAANPAPTVGRYRATTTATDFCHDVAAAVFESLSELNESDAERAVMDAYLHSAESVTDQNELCLALLAAMATEIDARLPPTRQHRVLRDAASRLGESPGTGDPLEATLAIFGGLSLVESYAVAATRSARTARSRRSWRLRLDGYAFDRATDRLPTLPLAVALLRRVPDETVAITDAKSISEKSLQCVVTAGGDRATGLAAVAIPE